MTDLWAEFFAGTSIHLGFTGTRFGMTPEQHEATERFLFELVHRIQVAAVHHGDCLGADAQFHRMAERLDLMIYLHPPTSSLLRANCTADVTYAPLDFLDRDRVIVEETQLLLATPRSQVPTRRSGTWATLRMARQLGRPAMVITPEGRWWPEI